MARLRKEKGGSSHASSTPKTKPIFKIPAKRGDAALREQVSALGGTQDDLDLLKGASDNAKGGGSTEDVCYGSAFKLLIK